MPVEKFKDKESYRRWNAYRHIHHIPAPHLDKVTIGGKTHKVKHSKLSKKKGKKRG